MFTQVLALFQKGGLVKLVHVSLDGTKVKANASKHKAMSYGRMKKKASELEAEVKRLLAQAEATDAAEERQSRRRTRPRLGVRIKTQTGQNPKCLTEDSGYYSQHQAERLPEGIDTYIATQKRNAQGKNGQKATYDQGSVHLRKEKAYR